MNRKFLSVLAAGVMFFGLASCTQKEIVPENGGLVTFTAELPGGMTKAYGDGTTATHLRYYVYDEDNGSVVIDGLCGEAEFVNLKANISLKLLVGKQYSIVFWAETPGTTPFTYEADTKELSIDYAGATAQDETRDAFFAYEGAFTVDNNGLDKTIILKRPYAQINVGTSDIEDAVIAGGSRLSETGMTVKDVYTAMNLATGEVVEDSKTDVTFGMNALPAAGEEFPCKDVTGYDYIGMNYVLVPTDQITVDIDFNHNGTMSGTTTTLTWTAVPVQRNWRTNIYGELLTNSVNYNVEIDPIFENESNVVVINSSAALIKALENQKDGQIWKLAAGTYDVTKGHDGDYPGTKSSRFVITANDLTITGVPGNTFIKASADALMQGGNPDVWEHNQGSTIQVYGENVTLEGLTVRGIDCTEAYGEPSGNKAVTPFGANGFKMINCEVLPAENGNGGSLIFDGEWSGKAAIIENTTIKGALITKYMAPAGFNERVITLKDVEINPEPIDGVEPNYYGPFSSSENVKEVVAVEGFLRLHVYDYMKGFAEFPYEKTLANFPDGAEVISHLTEETVKNVTTNETYSTVSEALAAANAGETILAEGVSCTDNIEVKAGVILDGGKTSTFSGNIIMREGAQLRNLTSAWNGGQREAVSVTASDVTIDNVIFKYAGEHARPEAVVSWAGAKNFTILNCKFYKYWKGIYLNTTVGFVIEDCLFDTMNPFSTDEWDASLVATGNTFLGNEITWRAPHFVVTGGTEGMEGTTKYQESWPLALQQSVYDLFTLNTFENKPYMRVQYVEGAAGSATVWDYKDIQFSFDSFFSGEIKNNPNNKIADRYHPSAYEFTTFDGKQDVLKYVLDERTNEENRLYPGDFYKTQGLKYNVFNPEQITKWEVSGEIYVDAQTLETNKLFRSEIWADAYEYPIISIANVDGAKAVVRTWKADGTWDIVEGLEVTAGWHEVKIVSDGNNVSYYFNGVEVGKLSDTSVQLYLKAIMPQAYHFDGDYTCETYFANVKYTLTK